MKQVLLLPLPLENLTKTEKKISMNIYWKSLKKKQIIYKAKKVLAEKLQRHKVPSNKINKYLYINLYSEWIIDSLKIEDNLNYYINTYVYRD